MTRMIAGSVAMLLLAATSAFGQMPERAASTAAAGVDASVGVHAAEPTAAAVPSPYLARSASVATWRAQLPADASRHSVVSMGRPHLSRSGVRGAVWGGAVGGAGGLAFAYMLRGLCDSDPCGDSAAEMLSVAATGAVGGAVLGYGIGALVGWAHRPRERNE